MYKGMRKVYVTAIVAVLVLSGMVFIANLGDKSEAVSTKKLWGYIKEKGTGDPIGDATVTAKKVQELGDISSPTIETYQSSFSGYYYLMLTSGYYIVSATHPDYFPNTTEPFRFDATSNISLFNIFLEKKLPMDVWFDGTVVNATTAMAINETISFTTTKIDNEVTNSRFKSYGPGQNYTNLEYFPVKKGTVMGTWNSSEISKSTHYTIDLWTGNITILNDTISACLSNPPCGYLNFTYEYSFVDSSVQNAPVTTYAAYKNATVWPENSNYSFDNYAGKVTILSNFTFGADVLKFTYEYYPEKISGAEVSFYDKIHNETVATATTNIQGNFNVSLWKGDYELRIKASDFQPFVFNYSITDNISTPLEVSRRILVRGWLFDFDDKSPILNTQINAVLINIDSALPFYKRIIATAETIDEYFRFDAYLGDFLLVVDADGYEASVMNVSFTQDITYEYLPIYLNKSDEETFTTEISFINDDWNNITVYRNITLNADSRIFGLDYDDIRNTELQLDLVLGNADGILNITELNSFKDWVSKRGPGYTTTEGFFTINSLNYISWFNDLSLSDTEYTATVERSADNFWINTTTYYTTNFTDFTTGSIGSGLVALNESTYWLNLTMQEDTSTDVYRNYSYLIRLPEAPDGNRYELNLSGSSDPLNFNVSGYINITIDPSSKATQPTYFMKIDKSLNGTARAKVTGPAGKYHVLNSSWDNYTAIVAMEENITFSAADSKDPNQEHLEGANYTWRFKYEVNGMHNPLIAYDPANTGYDMEPIFNYTSDGNYTVWLNLTEAGGNITYTNISVLVDGTNSTAVIEADDMTIQSIGMYRHLYINQSVPVKLNGSSSTDIIWGSIPGEIKEWRWHWTYLLNNTTASSLGAIWVMTFPDPGEYNLALNVTDGVGHLSPTVNITVFVNDTIAPLPDFMILENGTWKEVITLIEKELYWFNASFTVDNYDSLENLTFNWTFGDGMNASGVNVSHTFELHGIYNITLTSWDKVGNEGNTTYSIVVQPNQTARPDIKIIEESFAVTPVSPEQGVTATLSVNITNKEGHAKAFNVTVRFFAIKGEDEKEITGTVRFYNATGIEISNIIDTNETVTVKISWTPDTHGNFTIKINATTDNEHSGAILDNTITAYVNVLESGLTRTLTYAVIIAVPVILILIIWLRRKYKRGELFRKREEEEEERGRKRRKKKFKRIKEEEEE